MIKMICIATLLYNMTTEKFTLQDYKNAHIAQDYCESEKKSNGCLEEYVKLKTSASFKCGAKEE